MRYLFLGLFLFILMGLSTSQVGAFTLEQAWRHVLENSPPLKSQEAQTRASKKRLHQEHSNYLPHLDAQGQWYVTSETDGDFDNSDRYPRIGSVNATQSIFRGGQTYYGIRGAKRRYRSAQQDYLATEQRLFLDTAQAFLTVIENETVVAITENNVEFLDRNRQAVSDRLEVGDVTRTDLAQAEARLAGSKARWIGSKGRYELAKATYKRIMGIEAENLQAPDPINQLPMTLNEALTAARANNPSLEAARLARDAALLESRKERGKLFPEISLFGRLAHEHFDSGNNEAQAGVQVEIPIFEGGRNYHNWSESKFNYQTENQNYLDQERRIEEITVQAWTVFQTTKAEREAFETQVEANQIALEGVKREESVGTRTVLDVLDAEQELLDAQVNLANSFTREYIAGLTLKATMGLLTRQAVFGDNP